VTVFVDTSAWYALLSSDDPNHDRAEALLEELRRTQEPLATHNYVVVESAALIERRLGRKSAARLFADLVPTADMEWIQPSLHDVALAAYLATGSRTSLVDHVSFALMRARAINTAFAFDADFKAQGFQVLGG
jgi:predicted nucleic acid-binding protein